jgi:hypothetical protein
LVGPKSVSSQTRIALAAFLGLAPPYKICVALLRRATSVNESFPLIAAALDEDLGLEVDVGAALNIVAYVIAVLLGCQPSCCPFAGVDTQPSHVAILLCGGVSNLNAFLEEFVCLRLARARVSLRKVLVEIESWRELPGNRIEFTVRPDCARGDTTSLGSRDGS